VWDGSGRVVEQRAYMKLTKIGVSSVYWLRLINNVEAFVLVKHSIKQSLTVPVSLCSVEEPVGAYQAPSGLGGATDRLNDENPGSAN